jgi:hypothetical protein
MEPHPRTSAAWCAQGRQATALGQQVGRGCQVSWVSSLQRIDPNEPSNDRRIRFGAVLKVDIFEKLLREVLIIGPARWENPFGDL